MFKAKFMKKVYKVNKIIFFMSFGEKEAQEFK